MKLPFSIDQFMEVFARYNQAIWPAPIFMNLLALFALIMLTRKTLLAENPFQVKGMTGAICSPWYVGRIPSIHCVMAT